MSDGESAPQTVLLDTDAESEAESEDAWEDVPEWPGPAAAGAAAGAVTSTPATSRAASVPAQYDEEGYLVVTMKKPLQPATEEQLKQYKEAQAAIDRLRRQTMMMVHKTHLLCLLAAAQHWNRRCNDDELQQTLRQMVPADVGGDAMSLCSWLHSVIAAARQQPDSKGKGSDSQSSPHLQQKRQQEQEQLNETNGHSRKRPRSAAEVVVVGDSDEEVIGVSAGAGSDAYDGCEIVIADGKAAHRRSRRTDDDDDDPPLQALRQCAQKLRRFCDHQSQSHSEAPTPLQVAAISTALLRAYRHSARLVLAFRPVDWRDRTGERKSAKRKRSKGSKAIVVNNSSAGDGSSGKADSTNQPSPSRAPSSTSANAKVVVTPPAVCMLSSYIEPSVDDPFPASWTEVDMGGDTDWTPLSVHHGQFGAAEHLEGLSGVGRFVYVIGLDNDGNTRDVTARYARDWLTLTEKLRVPEEWWAESLAPLNADSLQSHAAVEKERERLHQRQLSQSLPRALSEFKDHRLYALERHLKKTEAILPGAKAVGFCKGEAVYRRSDVAVLKSRNVWLREARVVPETCEPVKQSKGRRKSEEGMVEDVDLFGEWQTTDYVPPAVVDGIVPKNEFGHVDLFTPAMLPSGGAFLDDVRYVKVAALLGVSCARAVSGFEFVSGRMVPNFSGVVVPAEAVGLLRDSLRQQLQQDKGKRPNDHHSKAKRRSRADDDDDEEDDEDQFD
eukprot:m.144064 g.144064  ORF g.144064 m.144064 type:complete len:724 (-) comp16757_c0_seq1:457-2628(-)